MDSLSSATPKFPLEGELVGSANFDGLYACFCFSPSFEDAVSDDRGGRDGGPLVNNGALLGLRVVDHIKLRGLSKRRSRECNRKCGSKSNTRHSFLLR